MQPHLFAYKAILLMGCLSVTLSVRSQTPSTFSGIVSSAEDGKPLPFAYIILKNVKLGTVTDENGRFHITISDQYKNGHLQFSYVGYKTSELSISTIPDIHKVYVRLTPDVKLLSEVVVKAQPEYTPKELLKKMLDRVPKNYGNVSVNMEGYYRETVKENNGYIKYADAACLFYYTPYTGDSYKWRDFVNPYFIRGSLSNLSGYWGERLHRGHFSHKTLKDDGVKIIDSRASANQSKKNMNANIEGGPMSVLGNDLIKIQEYFLKKKNFSKYEYTLTEELDQARNEWVYVLGFERKVDLAKLELAAKRKKINSYLLNVKGNMLSGKIYIERHTLAARKVEYFVPSSLKKYICGYTTMAIKHFDYKVTLEYQQLNGKWYPHHFRQEDEFIINDSIKQTITPYIAVEELFIHKVKSDSVKKIKPEELFANVDQNQLYDYPIEYDSSFWVNYNQAFPAYSIPEDVRQDMETTKKLEQQFADKQKKDESLLPPVAKKEEYQFKIHGESITDEYAWLKDTKAPKSDKPVMDYLTAENQYSDNYFIPLRKNQRSIFSELTSRVEKNFESLPTLEDGYLYYYKFGTDDEHPRYYRKAQRKDKEELLLDVNELAANKDFYTAGGITVSPNTNIMAFYENSDGTNDRTVKFKDLSTGELLSDSLTQAGTLVWASNKIIYYTIQEPTTDRSYRLMKHQLGRAQSTDDLVAEEKDNRFSLSISRSKSKQFIFLTASSKTSNETRFLSLKNPGGDFRLILPREEDHQYYVSHFKDNFFIASNKNAPNYKVMITDTANYSRPNWRQFLPHRSDVLLEEIEFFDDYYVLQEKSNAQTQLRIVEVATKKENVIKTNESICEVKIGYNPETKTDTLQYSYSSFTEPLTVYNYSMKTGKQIMVKKQVVPYMPWMRSIKVERLLATAKDGKKVPLTLVYNKYLQGSKKMDGKRVLLTSYGAYGAPMPVGFNSTIFSWIDRGFVYAIAHIRGGSDLGMPWYDDGKLLHKKNTFTDFIACAEHLVNEGYVLSGNIVAQGGSAGGLLMGAVSNMRPDLFKAVILDVPFVDVVNSMLDESLPLTTTEYEEWGNPKNKKFYEYMKSYSPYDNIRQQNYPNMFFFTGLNDKNVSYWESAKMVAKLRANNTGETTILLKTDFNSGHGGGSGRYDSYRELSYKMALIFDLFEKTKTLVKVDQP
ncbi:MAG: prolyl oligopeptidase family serine peptidase [Cyclobacteriaceae bacterium]